MKELLFALGIGLNFSVAAEEPTNTAAQIHLSDHFLRQLTVSSSGNVSVQAQGMTLNPYVGFQVTNQTADSSSLGRIDFGIDLEGSASVTRSQRGKVFKRKVDGVTIHAHVDGDFSKTVFVTPDGLMSGPFSGNADIDVSVNPFTNRNGPFRGLALGIAGAKGRQAVSALKPQAQAYINAEVLRVADQAVTEGNKLLQDRFRNVSPVLANPALFPFQAGFSSHETDAAKWGDLKLDFKGEEDKKHAPAPQMRLAHQAASQLAIHQDLFIKTLQPQLAGKQMKLADLHAILCDGRFGKALDFCQRDLKGREGKISLLFDETDPIGIDFKDGQIALRLNVIHQVHRDPEESGKLLTEPSPKEEVRFRGKPYTVEVTYALEGNQARRTGVRVRDRQSPLGEKSNDGKHQDGILKRVASGVLSVAERILLLRAYQKAFKETIETPGLAIPLQYRLTNPMDRKSAKMTQAGVLHPLEVKSDDGWFIASHYLCPDGMAALGVEFGFHQHENGVGTLLLKNVTAYSPGLLGGLRNGDQIVGFRKKSETEFTKVTSHWEVFLKHTREIAAKSPQEKLVVKVFDNQGKWVEREIALCPPAKDSRAAAQQTISSLK